LISQLTDYLNKPYHLLKIVLDDPAQKNLLDTINPGFDYEHHLNYIIDIDKSEDAIWKSISDKGRNKIKGAAKKGISLKI